MRKPVNRTHLLVAACAGMFVLGVVVALLGALFGLPEMRARLQIDLAQQGDLFFGLYLGLLATTVVIGPVIDRFGHKGVLVLSSLLVATGLLGFTLARSFAGAALPAVLLGLGGGGLNTSPNALVSDLYPENRGSMLNVVGVFFGVGALSIPLVVAGLAGLLSITGLMLLVAAFTVVCAAAYLWLPFPPPKEATSFSIRAAAGAVRYPGVLLFATVLFFESGNEGCIGGWTSTYVGYLGWSPRAATWVLAAYWGAVMIGRMWSARTLGRSSKAAVVLRRALASAVGCALLLSAQSIGMLVAGSVLTGFSFGGIFPTVLAMAGDRYARFAGTVFGVLFSISLLGGMTFPWALGHVSQAFGVRSGMTIPVAGAAVISIVAAFLYRQEQRAAQEPPVRQVV